MRAGTFIKRTRGSVALATAAMMATAMALGGVAHASVPTSNGMIYACYDTSRMLIIDTDVKSACPNSTDSVVGWSQTGVQGPRGNAGPQGPQGVAGPAGPVGPNGRNDQHWVVTTKTGMGFASDPNDFVYYWLPGRRFVYINGVDLNKCAINATAEDPTLDASARPMTTAVVRWTSNWLLVETYTQAAEGSFTYVDVPADVVTSC